CAGEGVYDGYYDWYFDVW
nr:immunoglobulin heavy chain junction region [Mus musculus]